MPPKISIFIDALGYGGAERMMLNLAGGIADTGMAVDLVLVRAKGAFVSAIPANVRLVDLKGGRVMRSIPAVARYLRRERPTAMLSALTHVNVAATLASYLAGWPSRLVVSERTTISREAAEVRALSNRIVYWLVPWLYPRAHGIIAVSQGAADDLACFCRMPAERIAVVNNPVVSAALLARAAEPLDHPWFAPGGPPVIIGVGRLNPEKEYDTLIRAFAQLAPRRPARLMILGDGTERPVLEALIDQFDLHDRVLLPGFIGNPYAYMSRAAVVVLSSRWEGSPNVLVEAMACGTPVVATNCRSGPAEVLEGGRLGPLVPVGDAAAMAAAIEQVLDAPVPPDQLKQKAGLYSVANAAQDYLRVLLGDSGANR